MRTKIEHVTILTMNDKNDVYKNASITFEDDVITGINCDSDADTIIDGKGAICMPGMINTHSHFSMIPFRSLQDDCPDRLRKFLLPLEGSAMNAKLAAAACKVGIAESLLAGVTTTVDMYYFPDALAQSFATMNMRAVVGETILKQPTCDTDQPHGGLAIAEQFIQQWKGHPLITPAIAPHGTNTVSIEALQKANEISRHYDVLMPIHVSEMDYEMKYFMDEYKMTPIAFLQSIGVLSERLIAVHAIHTQGDDFAIMKKHGVRVAHCISSNTKAAKGIAPVKEMVAHDIPVGLGTDGPSSGNTLDLFTQMNMFVKCQKVKNKDRTLFPAQQVVHMATRGGAEVLRMDHMIGSLEVGKKADLVLVETDSVNMFPLFDPYSILVYSANPSNVHSVWVNGIHVVKDHQLVLHDVKQLKRECWQQMEFFVQEAQRLSDLLEQQK